MTEEEAKTKWCPHTRVGINAKAGVFGRWANFTANRFGNEEPRSYCRCMASDCMMWVATGGEWMVDGVKISDDVITPESVGATWIDKGHCGLINARQNA